MPVVVQVESGQVTITNGESGQVVLSGAVNLADQDGPLVTLQLDGLHVTADDRRSVVNVSLQVPPGTQVEVDTYGAEVKAHNFSGNLDVTSTAGDILIIDMEGLAILRANRGDVIVESSSGEFHLPGNYGLLSLTDVSGNIEASTIMGTVRFQGRVGAADKVKLETDHGPVKAWLDPGSDVTVMVGTTTGVVDCVVQGLSLDGAGCMGQLGNGGGSLQIRTVSGEVDLGTTP